MTLAGTMCTFPVSFECVCACMRECVCVCFRLTQWYLAYLVQQGLFFVTRILNISFFFVMSPPLYCFSFQSRLESDIVFSSFFNILLIFNFLLSNTLKLHNFCKQLVWFWSSLAFSTKNMNHFSLSDGHWGLVCEPVRVAR